ncbi:MAG: hypothetical protein HFF22_10185 [Oscillospiraceae bacterium]|nr:hypothetical protein [Oscillospiraceae bacterium]
MTDWIAVLLGEDGESGDEERLVLDGASEGVRLPLLRPPGAEDEVEPAEAPDGDGPDWTDGPEGLPGETDWAQVRADGPEGAVWSEELDPETGRTVWTLARAGLGRETDGAWDAGTEADGAAGPGRRPEAGTAGSALAGLAELYRGAASEGRAPAPAAVPEGGRRTVLERTAEGAPGLTVEELDRAVRRDSRRYDGGMSIF